MRTKWLSVHEAPRTETAKVFAIMMVILHLPILSPLEDFIFFIPQILPEGPLVARPCAGTGIQWQSAVSALIMSTQDRGHHQTGQLVSAAKT